jgi:arylsulfatase A-like enzyme
VKEAYGLGMQLQADGRYGHGGAYATDLSVDDARGIATVWLVQDADAKKPSNACGATVDAWLATRPWTAAPPPAAAATRPNILVIYSDDHGWADLAIQGVDKDVRTPNLDQLARDGVRFTRGYVSAPQCVPSRAGLITGRYQQRFGVEDNNHGPLPLAEQTIAERLAPAGYTSGWVGKCHLDIGGEKRKADGFQLMPDHMPHHQGFAEYFRGELRRYHASHGLDGKPFPDAPRLVTDDRFRVVVQTDAALSFLDRRAAAPDKPWFLYLAWYAPHVPLDSPEPWFSQTPASLPKERRQALAMIAAMDDGLGQIRDKLRAMGVEKNTLIVFVGDNGAPLDRAWNGSVNLPLVGQKGMLSEGGIRTPFLAAWPGTWPAGVVYEKPVINLDLAATAIAAAGLPADPVLDGVNLTPFVTGATSAAPHERLFWRWIAQAAVLEMPYKLIRLGDNPPLLFDVTTPEGEDIDRNLAAKQPEIVARLDAALAAWAAGLEPPGLVADPSAPTRQPQKLFTGHHLLAP